jgi:hypothetical protein
MTHFVMLLMNPISSAILMKSFGQPALSRDGPSQKRLNTDDTLIGHPDFRLIDDGKLLVFNRAFEGHH